MEYLIEEKGLKMKRDYQGKTCLELSCEEFFNEKSRGAREEMQKRRAKLVEYLLRE